MQLFVETSWLRIAYLATGQSSGWPVVLLHGFPYDVRAYDEVAEHLVDAGARVYVPYLRGYGPTEFLSASTLRSGEQAALGQDLREFIERVPIACPIVAGYDWGGRAACVVSALWPELIAGLVSCSSYNLQNIAGSVNPLAPEQEHRLWYQYYFNLERGRHGLTQNREALCKLLWQLWSPSWNFSAATYLQTAQSFLNTDFVDIVIHSYRHRFGMVAGDAAFADIERKLAARPLIPVASVTLDGTTDGVSGGSTAHHASQFSGRHEHLMVEGAGHNLPQEAPKEFARAIIKLHGWLDR